MAFEPVRPRDAQRGQRLVHRAVLAVEQQAEHGRVGDLSHHDRGEEGEAEQGARPQHRGVQRHREADRQGQHDGHLQHEEGQRVFERAQEHGVADEAAPIGRRAEHRSGAPRVLQRKDDRLHDGPGPERREDREVGQQEPVGDGASAHRKTR